MLSLTTDKKHHAVIARSTEELDSGCSHDHGPDDSKPHSGFPLQVLDLFLHPHDALRQQWVLMVFQLFYRRAHHFISSTIASRSNAPNAAKERNSRMVSQ